MEKRLSAIERAFELAKSGTVKTLDELKQVLNREGFLASTIEGPILHRQLRALMIEAAKPVERDANSPV